jgi:AcrR family transcriptional regulator
MTRPAPPRPATGGAQLRAPVTDAITTAALDELVESGYSRMSMEAVARRAKVGKAALYRRWNSKQEMIEQIVGDLSWSAVPIPDTGTLRGDVDSYLAHAAALRQDLRATRIIADLGAEAIRNPRLAQVFATTLREPRRAAGAAMLRKAADRGELPGNIDTDLALDCLVGLVYARPQSMTAAGELADPYPRDRLVRVILAAIAACTPQTLA